MNWKYFIRETIDKFMLKFLVKVFKAEHDSGELYAVLSCPKIQMSIWLSIVVSKTGNLMANSADPEHTIFFLFVHKKYRLWILIRNASDRRF